MIDRLALVVLDTNVLLAGLRSPHGASYLLLRHLDSGAFDIDLSVPLVLEYQDVRLRPRSRLGMEPARISATVDALCDIGNHYRIYFLLRPSLSDPKDEHLLELAVRARF